MSTPIRTIVVAGLAVSLLTAGGGGAGFPCGDVNQSGDVTASDSLAVLRFAVGQPVDLFCTLLGKLPRTGETTSFGAGSDGALQVGTARSFTDNGDGTISDNVTGLMWQRMGFGVAGTYTWSTGTNNMDGTIQTVFLPSLNDGAGFAGYTDWRIPNLAELESIRNAGASNPSAFPEFHTGCVPGCTVSNCSCTTANTFCTSTTFKYNTTSAWAVYFLDGLSFGWPKTSNCFARAVRTATD